MLVDCGYGSMLRLSQSGYNVTDLDAIVLTHFHLDHCGEILGILKARWLNNAGNIDIYSPKGGGKILNKFLEAFKYLNEKIKYRIHEIDDKESFSIGNLKFTAKKTVHSVESLGFVVNGILISGDTSAFSSLYEDVEITIHEMSLDFGGNADFHTSPENFAENAVEIRKAFLIHMYPPAYNNRMNIANYLEKHRISTEFPNDLQVLEF